MKWKKLTAEEERIIVHCGTERAFSGKYHDHHEPGVYRCRRCTAVLFDSTAKFDSRTGWPSFDEAVAGAVDERSDPDGSRTEIVCSQCRAHLGHVFRGEGFTDKDVRHCVNSASLDFEPSEENAPSQVQEAYFAGGCFWGVEHLMAQVPGVVQVTSGYMGGHVEQPSYEQVCGGGTGHAEAVRVVFDPNQTSYEQLARLFFEIHDPTQRDRQGPDVGAQYRSVVFYRSEEQRETAAQLIAELEQLGYDVVTALEPAGPFWPAEPYHQDYYARNGQAPYCHRRVERFAR